MFRKLAVIFALLIGCKSTQSIDSIKSTETLFSINEESVTDEEFEYVYSKNNVNNDSAFQHDDIKEYLNLYINFKLKIAEAKSLGMDTTKAFKDEFNSYLDQLKQPYLTETKVTNHLIEEAYNRYKEEINASHILIKINDPLNPSDTLMAYNKALDIRNQAISGKDFADLAKQYSDDPSAKINGGNLGYFTSFQMVYPFESAAYSTKKGSISMPVRTQFGYHIVKVLDRRPTNGSVQVAHIMVRVKGDSVSAKNKIFEILEQAQGGVSWEELVKQYSDDINSKNTNGILKAFTVGQMPFQFQEAAFALTEEGSISDPIMTSYGWHIIKLIKREPVEPFDKMEATIKSRIGRDSRAQLNKKALISRLKRENGFSENLENRTLAIAIADSTIAKGKWKNRSSINIDLRLFTVAKNDFKVGDFISYVEEHQKPNSYSPKIYMDLLYNSFQEESIIAYEEAHLSEKYIDYRMIIKEYREGILLFKLMEDEVWNKAVIDTVGLKTYFENNKENYKWSKRAKATIYSSHDIKVINDISQAVEKNDSTFLTKQNLYEKYNSSSTLNLEVDSGNFEKGSNEVLDQCQWVVGQQRMNFAGKVHLVWIKSLSDPQQKTLNETKGAVISDYQGFLEKEWLKKLKDKYTVTIDDEVLRKVYESLEKK